MTQFNIEKENCAICMSEVSMPLPLCGHWIHEGCILQWGVAKCPVCRQEQPDLYLYLNRYIDELPSENSVFTIHHYSDQQFRERIMRIIDADLDTIFSKLTCLVG
jgi:hypothetical protein